MSCPPRGIAYGPRPEGSLVDGDGSHDLLNPTDAATLLDWMRSATAIATDGFDQSFGLLADGSDTVAANQGWMCCVDGRRQLHSAGVLDDGRVIVLLGDFPPSTSWVQATTALDTAAAVSGVGTDAIG